LNFEDAIEAVQRDLNEGEDHPHLGLIFEVVKSRVTAFLIRENAKLRLAKQAKEAQLADFASRTCREPCSWVRFTEAAKWRKHLCGRLRRR
jgi:hypothetical protein